MARSLKKGPFVDLHLIKKVETAAASSKKPIKTWSRRSMILPGDGRFHDRRPQRQGQHVPVLVNENMVGHKLGEFAVDPHLQGSRRRQEGRRQVRDMDNGSESHPPHGAHLAAEGPPGRRPGARPAGRRARCDMLKFSDKKAAAHHPQGAATRRSSNAENNIGADVDELKVAHDHRRRRSGPEALHGPRQGPRHPHPQAHQPHHRGRGSRQVSEGMNDGS